MPRSQTPSRSAFIARLWQGPSSRYCLKIVTAPMFWQAALGPEPTQCCLLDGRQHLPPMVRRSIRACSVRTIVLGTSGDSQRAVLGHAGDCCSTALGCLASAPVFARRSKHYRILMSLRTAWPQAGALCGQNRGNHSAPTMKSPHTVCSGITRDPQNVGPTPLPFSVGGEKGAGDAGAPASAGQRGAPAVCQSITEIAALPGISGIINKSAKQISQKKVEH